MRTGRGEEERGREIPIGIRSEVTVEDALLWCHELARFDDGNG